MKKIEQWILGLIMGAVLPICGLLAGWWCTFSLLSTPWVIVCAVSGLIAGLVLDAFLLKSWVAKAYRLDIKIWMVIYIFYSVCIFGFFMGVPVFNLALAVPAGLLMGVRLAQQKAAAEKSKKVILQTRLFTTFIFAGICAASAWLALSSPSTASDLEGMLRLGFDVTLPMIVGIIAVGGALLLLSQWWLVARCIQISNRWKLQGSR